ncbi:hypothetical protein [Saccharopolyspora sp. NPDC049426]|uniref:sunset domain-containing protein n=1 Tax=Saccharopolyspora sp. NPDC049426 TaxID=3155652 RepID=UPI00344173C7
MITWLFTQVWLWSLAAFLFGALVTWALFVRPLRRRLKAELARPRYAEPVYDEPIYDETVYETYADEPVTEHRSLDLLEQRSPQWEAPEEQRSPQWEAPEEQRAPQWEAPEDQRPPQWEAPEQQRAPQWEAPEEQDLDEWDRRPRPWVATETTRSAPVETQRLPEPEPEPEPEAPSGDNTWFRNPEVEEPRTESRPSQFPPGADAEEADQLSGQLRSLFEPESSGDAGEPYKPPIGADATQVIPPVPGEQPQASGSLNGDGTEAKPLPKRTPQPRSDSAVQADPPNIPDSLRQRVQSGEPLSRGDEGAEPPEINLVDNPDDSAPLPRRTPGAGPHPGRDAKWEKPSETSQAQEPVPDRPEPRRAGAEAPRPAPAQAPASAGPMIKGHSASRTYHTPDSPQYDQISADVWFRTPSDAEIAGFESWNRS